MTSGPAIGDAAPRPASRLPGDAVRPIAAIIALAVIVMLAWHARAYFFLYDDFSLVGVAAKGPWTYLASAPLFGFYRPLVFLLARVEFLLFGWQWPWGYALVSVLLHLTNAALVWRLARQCGVGPRGRDLAAVCFLLSPWASEGVFWYSARFDLLCTFGMLLALTSLARPGLTGATGILVGATVAAFSKETAVVLPPLALLILWLTPMTRASTRPSTHSVRHTLLLLLLVAAPIAVYLFVRIGLIGAFAGAYGDWRQLMADGSFVRNAGLYLLRFASVPVITGAPPDSIDLSRVLAFMFQFVVLPALLLASLRRTPRLIWLCAIAFALSILPVCWFGPAPASTVASRFAYLPGVWFALAAGAGLAALVQGLDRIAGRGERLLATSLVLLLAFGYYIDSIRTQAGVWTAASAIARTSIEQFRPYVGRTDTAIRITNLPAMFAEGPYVLKAYAFRNYYAPRPVPPVKADMTLLRRHRDAVIPVHALGVDSSSDYLDAVPPGLREETVTLTIPRRP